MLHIGLIVACYVALCNAGAADVVLSNDGPFSNMTDLEWELMQSTGYIRSELPQSGSKITFSESEINQALNTEIDWHERFSGGTRVMTRIKNQGACGACYIFSVLVALETLYANQTGTLVSLSEQSVLDCVNATGMFGCAGGNPLALATALLNFKVPYEKDYPYSWNTFSTATPGQCGAVAGVLSPTKVVQLDFTRSNHEDIMAAFVYFNGPLQVSIDTRNPLFKTYKSGIIDIPSSGAVTLTHGVTIVGYGEEQTPNGPLPYWKLKNSWGPQWGENGYFRLARGMKMCGVDLDPVGLIL